MGQTGVRPILSHSTMGRDGQRDTYIASSKWDRLGYVDSFQWYNGTVGQDGQGIHAYIHTQVRPIFSHGTMGQDGHRERHRDIYMQT